MPAPINTRLKRALLNDDNGPRLYKFSGTTVNNAAAATYTAAAIFGGFILRDPNGGSRTDTLPTVTQIMDFLKALARFDGVTLPTDIAFDFIIQNTADDAETITVQSGTGGTNSGSHTLTIAQNASKEFRILLNTVVPSYTLWNRGGFTT